MLSHMLIKLSFDGCARIGRIGCRLRRELGFNCDSRELVLRVEFLRAIEGIAFEEGVL